MKLFELQRLPSIDTQIDAPLGVWPGLINTRIFLYGEHRPVLEGDPLDGHICGYRIVMEEGEEGEEKATLYETEQWSDTVQGTVMTNLEPKEIEKAKEFYGERYTLDVIPVITRSVRIQALIFK